jgi:uncharacterized protein (TIGR00369 family)
VRNRGDRTRVKNARRAAELLGGGFDGRNGWMQLLGARIAEAEPGRVVLELDAGPQHRHGGGVVQGGVITQIADAAMGMSLATLQEDRIWNTTIELKINFLRPVIEGRLRAVGRVVEIKQSLLFGEADVFDAQDRLIATASSTCMAVPEGQGRE